MSAQPLVSVVVPAHDHGRYLPQALESILGQQRVDLEVVVVDDGSTDGTSRVIDRYCADARVRGLAQPHQGASRARNHGIRQSHGRYIAFLDADDWWTEPDKLALQVGFLEAHPEVGWIFADMNHPGEAGGRGIAFLHDAGFYAGESSKARLVPLTLADLCRDGFLVPTGCVVVRRDCLEQAGLFDESLRMWEDLDLWIRLLRLSPVAFLPRVVMARRIHSANAGSLRYRHLDDLRVLARRYRLDLAGLDFRGEARRSHLYLAAEHLRGGAPALALRELVKAASSSFRKEIPCDPTPC